MARAPRKPRTAEKPAATPPPATNPGRPAAPAIALTLGSDIELSRALVATLRYRCRDHVVSDNGSLYGWTGTRWASVADDEVRRLVHDFDGSVYDWTGDGKPKTIKLTKGRVDSVIFEAGAMLGARAGDTSGFLVDDDDHGRGLGYFDAAPTGINCASGFIRIAPDGSADLLPHSPDHRQRHTLRGQWMGDGLDPCALLPGSLLHTLLEGAFRGDADAAGKVGLLQEVAGCGIARHATRLKKGQFVLLYGPGADNGKSQILDMITDLFPPHAVASVSVEDWADEKHRAALRDAAFNVMGELRGVAIESARFKEIVSGDAISARDVYASAVRFRPTALHLAASNKLPSFEGGFDRGVRARLLPIAFNRSIPEGEQVENIGKRIASEEANLLLAWAVEGARRVVPRGTYAIPASSTTTLESWMQRSDPVLAWIARCVEFVKTGEGAADTALLAQFKSWAAMEGLNERHLPQKAAFMSRLEGQPGVTLTGSRFRGLVVHEGGKPIEAEKAARDAAEAARAAAVDWSGTPPPRRPQPVPVHPKAWMHASGATAVAMVEDPSAHLSDEEFFQPAEGPPPSGDCPF